MSRRIGPHEPANAHRFIQSFVSPSRWQDVHLQGPAVTKLPPALAVIDGALCQLTRQGVHARSHIPLATAVVEFRHGPLCTYVREHPYGLLPGIPNLYCLDGDLRLQWMAEWTDPSDPCGRILEVTGDTLLVESAQGVRIRLEAHTGRLLAVEQTMSAAG